MVLPVSEKFPSITLFKNEGGEWVVPISWTLNKFLRSTAQKVLLKISSKYILHSFIDHGATELMRSYPAIVQNQYGKEVQHIKNTMKFCTIQTFLSCLRNARFEDVWATSTSAADISDFTQMVFSRINRMDKGKEEEPEEEPEKKRKRVTVKVTDPTHKKLKEDLRAIVAEEVRRAFTARYEAEIKEQIEQDIKNRLKDQFEGLFKKTE